MSNFPLSATSVNFEYTIDTSHQQQTTITQQPNDSTSVISSSTTTPSTTPITPSPAPLINSKLITKHVKLEKVHLVIYFPFSFCWFNIYYNY